jgi:hypothetical protein
MSNTYQLHQQIHTLIQEKAKKHGLEIEIEPTNLAGWKVPMCYTPDGEIWQMDYKKANKMFKTDKYVPILFAPQIRQILVAFKEVLGENPEKIDLTGLTGFESAFAIFKNGLIAKSYSKALDDKWLGASEDEEGNYQQPLIDREPETVLTELLEILQLI